MERYVVKITDEASIDMEALYHHIAFTLQSPDHALGQYNRIADAILSLDGFPERFRIVSFEPEHSREIRRMLVDNYTVFFAIDEDTVTVTNILYSASDIQTRLK